MKAELKTNMGTMKSVRETIKQPYAFPGGYEKFAIANDGGVLCHTCLKEEHYQIAHDTLKGWKTGWDIAGIDCACNLDESVLCDNCNAEIN